jgi:MerR family transcriptional regulator/heat shock protein HspR
VNLAGVEIILNMRAKMEAMQRQMEEFVQTLNKELNERAAAMERPGEANALVPLARVGGLEVVGGRRGWGGGSRNHSIAACATPTCGASPSPQFP